MFLKPVLCARHPYTQYNVHSMDLPHEKDTVLFHGPMDTASMELIHGQYVKGFDCCFKQTLASSYTDLSASGSITTPGSQIVTRKNPAPFKGSRYTFTLGGSFNMYQSINIYHDFCHQAFSTPFIKGMGFSIKRTSFPGPFPQWQKKKTVKFLRLREPEWLMCLTMSIISLSMFNIF